MKKLFLYIAFFGFIFWACFIITRDFFQNKEYAHSYTLLSDDDKAEAQQQENGSDSGKNDALSHVVGISARFSGLEDQRLGETFGEYVVTIDNEYIIVYENNGQSVFEYTEIDADLIKTLNSDLYEKLLEGIRFNTSEDIYRFLETISS